MTVQECAEILLAAEPEANVLDDDFRSPLHLAAMQGHTDCATLLCKKGMNVDAQDRRGQTALHLAGEFSPVLSAFHRQSVDGCIV